MKNPNAVKTIVARLTETALANKGKAKALITQVTGLKPLKLLDSYTEQITFEADFPEDLKKATAFIQKVDAAIKKIYPKMVKSTGKATSPDLKGSFFVEWTYDDVEGTRCLYLVQKEPGKLLIGVQDYGA